MKQKNIISNSFKESFRIIKKNKRVFVVLFFSQLIYLSLILAVNFNYQTKILEGSKSIIEYVDNLDLEDSTVATSFFQNQNALGEDPLLISRNFKNILFNLQLLLLFSFSVFVIANGVNWFATAYIVTMKNFVKKKKFYEIIIQYLLKFAVITLVFSISIYLLFISTLKNSLFSLIEGGGSLNMLLLFLLTLVLLYFMFLAFSLIPKLKFKEMIKKGFFIGVRNFWTLIFSYLIILIIISIFAFLIFYFIESNLFLVFISSLLFVESFVWARIFLLTVVEKLS